MKQWYVAHTQPHGEPRALANLLRQGFEAYLPRFRKWRRHARRTERVPAPLFPRYLFVAFDEATARWRAIHSTFGVHHLICTGDAPAPVPPGVVDDIRAREEDGFVSLGRLAAYKPGDPVRIAAGSLCDRIGLFERMDERERVVLLLEMLGRQVRVALPLDAVVAAS
ncbi:MAG: transcriptional activator RfaH [Alphaproteobacteria bacterium]